MKVVVTGAGKTGFLGQHVKKELCNTEFSTSNDVITFGSDINLLDPQEVDRVFLEFKPDVVVHMAAVCGGILANKNAPADFLTKNTLMSIYIYESARKYKKQYNKNIKIYTLGSVCSYPKFCPVPFKEDNLFNGYPEETNAPYGQAKRTLLMLGQTYRDQYGIGGAHLIPVNMYGECFSKDTTLATPTGFKNVADFKEGDEIYTLNPSTHEIELEKVVATQRKKTSQFVNFKGSVVDIRVTPEHKIYYKTNKTFLKRKAEWFMSRAGKKNGMIRFVKSNGMTEGTNLETTNCFISLTKWIDSGHEISNDNGDVKVRDHKYSYSHWVPTLYKSRDFYEFLGWYVSKGSINSDKISQISISQSLSNKHHRLEIKDLLKRMGLSAQYDDYRLYFSSRLWENFIEEEIGRSNSAKKIPEKYLKTSKELLEVLFNALMKGNGNKDGSRYSTKSDILKDQIILIATLIGKQVGKVYKEGDCWRIPFRKRKTSAVKYKNISVENVDSEDVFCVTTEKNHIVYAKRNDKCTWIGQCDHFDLVNSHVIPALINKFINAKENNLPNVNVWGTGNVTREFLYAGDCAKAIRRAIDIKLDTSLPINIGTGKEISIKKLAYILRQIIDYTGEIIFTGEVSDGQPRRKLDVSRAKQLMNFTANTSLEDGLKKTIKWYIENKNNNQED